VFFISIYNGLLSTFRYLKGPHQPNPEYREDIPIDPFKDSPAFAACFTDVISGEIGGSPAKNSHLGNNDPIDHVDAAGNRHRASYSDEEGGMGIGNAPRSALRKTIAKKRRGMIPPFLAHPILAIVLFIYGSEPYTLMESRPENMPQEWNTSLVGPWRSSEQ
jgi:hypothetical protein